MSENIHQLKTSEISSEVFVISPAMIDRIATTFADNVADAMNMRTFAPKMREIARDAMRATLRAARKMGAE